VGKEEEVGEDNLSSKIGENEEEEEGGRRKRRRRKRRRGEGRTGKENLYRRVAEAKGTSFVLPTHPNRSILWRETEEKMMRRR